MSASYCDVLVVGGGPAGCATAIALARQGRQVLLVERSRCDGVRIGETLPPRARPLLAALGLPAKLLDETHLAAPGIVSAWGSAEPYCNDFIVNPHGSGWHLDRPRFDRMLASQAADCRVDVRGETTITTLKADGDCWRVAVHGPRGDETVACRFVVDATGRHASPLKRRAGRRAVHDRLIGIAAFAPAEYTDRRTLIEATSEGWWYSTLLPDARQVVVHMTDADSIAGKRGELADGLRRRLHDAPLTRERCGDLRGVADVKPFAAMTSAYERAHGQNWLLVGDAAMTWDPLSGQGICKALESGMHAARAVDRALEGDPAELAAYGAWTRARFGEYMAGRARYYRAEQRWPDSPFWRRRHATL